MDFPFEHRREPLLPRSAFLGRIVRSALVFSALVACALAVGSVGYHAVGGLPWIDAILNAAMILTGMGPVDRMDTTPAKLFSAAYAVFSGVVFLSGMGVLVAPVFHRFMHRFHLEEDASD